jgi:hypothetical protein
VVEQIPITELSTVESLKDLHANLITNYAKQDWNYCEQAIEHLMGKWGGEVDSFYMELKTRTIRCGNNKTQTIRCRIENSKDSTSKKNSPRSWGSSCRPTTT